MKILTRNQTFEKIASDTTFPWLCDLIILLPLSKASIYNLKLFLKFTGHFSIIFSSKTTSSWSCACACAAPLWLV